MITFFIGMFLLMVRVLCFMFIVGVIALITKGAGITMYAILEAGATSIQSFAEKLRNWVSKKTQKGT